MTDSSTLPVILQHSFEHLADVVGSMASTGPTPTAAGVKTALIKIDQGFSEKVFGFEKFLAYLESAEASGFIRLARDAANHPRVFPVGPTSPTSSAALDVTSSNLGEAIGRGRKLRPDVWLSAIDWAPHSRRMWDRKAYRSFMFPTDPSGRPLWETEPDRFVEVSAVTMTMQTDWMHEFAEQQGDTAREALLKALERGAPRGSFKNALRRSHLVDAWSERLQERVASHLLEWARENDIDGARLFDRRSLATTTQQLEVSEGAATPAKHRVEQVVSQEGMKQDSTSKLRARLHAIIDSMSLAELASVSVPAAYLLDD